jgi:large subunit ribosomal protein L13
VDTGDYIVVINASGIKVTGNKMKDKIYYKHTGYIGNLKSMNLETMMNKSPERVLTRSVRGMLPKTKLGNVMIKKLKVFAGPEHDHGSQQPQTLEI